MEIVYQAIVDTINTHPEAFTNKGVPAPKMVDIYQGQPDDAEGFELFFPAVFINWEIQPGSNGESDTLFIEAHVLQEPGGHTESFGENISEGLQYLRILKAVKSCLNKLSTDISAPLAFNGEKPTVTPFFSYHVLKYKCSIDSDNESVHRPTYANTTIEAIKVNTGLLRKNNPEADLEIETYK